MFNHAIASKLRLGELYEYRFLPKTAYAVDCADDTRFVFQFPVGEAEVSRSGDDLVFVLENGVSITLKDFYASYTAQNMPAFEVEGMEIAGADFFAALDQPELMPAAGPEPANDSYYQEWSNMELLGGLDRLGGIDTGWQDGGRIDREGGNAEQAPQELNVLLAVSEGGTENDIREVTFTVSLDRVSLGDVTVTLSNGLTVVVPAGELSASVSIPTRTDDVYQQGGDVYSAAIENMLLAITALGYQSCWYEGHITDEDKIGCQMAQILGVPQDYELICFLPVGVGISEPVLPRKRPFDQRAWFNGFPQKDS